MMKLSRMPTTRYLMLKVAYHRPMSSPWVVRGAWAQMNSNTVMETSRETVESWGTDEVGFLISWCPVVAVLPCVSRLTLPLPTALTR